MDRQTRDNSYGFCYAQRLIHALVAGLCSLVLAPTAWSASLAISDSPLFLTAGVRPNVFIELDDSGSMDWEILTRKYWSYCEYDRDSDIEPYSGSNKICYTTQLDNGLWQSHSGSDTVDFVYIYNTSDNAFSTTCNDSDILQSLAECSNDTPYQNDWRIYSSDFNVLYYDPKQTYTPWLGDCDSSGRCDDAEFATARSNPREGTDGYTLKRNLNKFTWEVWVDDKGYKKTDGRPFRGNEINATSGSDRVIGVVDLWDKHITYTINGGKIDVVTTTYSPTSSGLNPVTSSKALSDPGACYTELVNDNTANCRTIAETKQNVANWYQYARKRQFVAKTGISAVIDLVPSFRYGLDTINQASSFIEVPAGLGNYGTHNDNLLEELYSFEWPASSTPLRKGLQRAGEYYNNSLSGHITTPPAIEYECQKNFTVLLTDGYWNETGPGLGDVDGDGANDTVADVARKYYLDDLSSSLPNNVVPDKDDFDPATYQHMVTYTLAFGVEGKLVDGTDPNDTPPVFGKGPGWPFPVLTENDDWGDPTSCTDCAEKIDDLWHAAYNSRGTFISATTPNEVTSGLLETIKNVQNTAGSASSVALSTGLLRADTRIYQALFDPSDWHGELLSIPIDLDSGIPDINNATDLGMKIQSSATRVMMTHNGTEGVLFEWTDISATQQDDLDKDATGTDDSKGEERLAWLRGDSDNETNNGGIFRNRTVSILGDIVNAAPIFVGAPEARYPDVWSGSPSAPENCSGCDTYSTFKTDNASRMHMIYAGTNGGTLNGFSTDLSDTSPEKLAYVPGSVFNNLSQLTDPGYIHQFYVDGTPTVVDAFFSSDSKWHTVLAGGLNSGGQGIYALDVTNPADFTASSPSAKNIVLWEFTDADDPDLGFTYSRPAIVRLPNGQWAAIFGNGYNNTDNDGNVSTTGHAVLFIVDIKTGALITKIDTEAGSTTTPNGLATPAVVDTNGDFIADAVYAGDLLGNLWKFNLTGTDPTKWDVAFHNSAFVPEPLYVARDNSSTPQRQPITVRPDVGSGPNGLHAMVYFGTGLYLQLADLTDTSEQTFYGILDTDSSFTGRTDLAEQTVDFQGTVNGIPIRVTSDNSAGDRGWFMDLTDTGERNISNPILRAGRIIFVTIIPDPDPCSSGGFSWLMELDAINGTRLDESPFDIDGNLTFDILDEVLVIDINNDGVIDDKDRVPVSGKGFGSLTQTPGILLKSDTEFKYTSNSGGGLDVTRENPGATAVGRQSWGQLR